MATVVVVATIVVRLAAVIAPVAAVMPAIMAVIVAVVAVVPTTTVVVIGEGRCHRAEGKQRGNGPDDKSIHAHDWPRLVD